MRLAVPLLVLSTLVTGCMHTPQRPISSDPSRAVVTYHVLGLEKTASGAT